MTAVVRTLSLCWIVALLALALPAFAQPSLSTRVSNRRPEVGESFTIQLSALSEDDRMPSSPALSAPPGFVMHGPSIGSQQQVSITGGSIVRRHGITATWTLVATKPGRYTIGPPTVSLGGRRLSGDRVTVEVVPAGQGRRTPNDPFDPFSLPGMPRLKLPQLPPLFGDPDSDQAEEIDGLPPYPEELRVDRAADPYAFLRAVVTPSRVVVGQQVTLKIFAYGRQGPFREEATSEPSRADFLGHTIVENSYGERTYRVPIENEVWLAQKVREVALFPIRAGTLTIGSMTMAFAGRGYATAGGKGLPRKSEPVQVIVTEPPIAGRPAGYHIGDVGQYSLTANVEPREVLAGEAISVVATLEGTGNVPFELRTPEQRGVQWLDPTIVSDVEVRGSTVSGTRKFSYVVRLKEAGRIELGELSLPFWDPTSDSYKVARAALGAIEVRANPNASQAESTDNDTDQLKGILALRKSLAAAPAAAAPWTDSLWFWLALVAGPLAVLLFGAGTRAIRWLRNRARSVRESAGTIAARELARARQAADPRDAASHVERALISAIEARTGLKARGILRAELTDELERAGVAHDSASELAALLSLCDEIRFTGGVDEEAGSDAGLVARAERAVKALGRRATPPASAGKRTPSSGDARPEPEPAAE